MLKIQLRMLRIQAKILLTMILEILHRIIQQKTHQAIITIKKIETYYLAIFNFIFRTKSVLLGTHIRLPISRKSFLILIFSNQSICILQACSQYSLNKKIEKSSSNTDYKRSNDYRMIFTIIN